MSLLINEPVEKDVQVMYYRLPMVALQGTINQFAGSSRQLGGQGVAWHDSARKKLATGQCQEEHHPFLIHFSCSIAVLEDPYCRPKISRVR